MTTPAISSVTANDGDDNLRHPIIDYLKRLVSNPVALLSGAFIFLLVAIALLAPWLAPYDPMSSDWSALATAPSAQHWFGTDDLGRDILSRILFGTRISLYVGFVSVLTGMFFGVLLGVLAGYYGGWVDSLVVRSADVLFAFPGMLLAIAIVAVLGPGINNVIIAVAVFGVPVFSRITRAATLSLRHQPYIEAARCMGASQRVIILRHILPGAMPSVIVYFTLRIGSSILTASGMSFIGLGPEPDVPEWGNILSTGRNMMMAGNWYISVFPGCAIFLTVLAFNMLGDSLRDILDPKLKR
ncbi:ABC transporter permease [Klebsiella pneumoniae]|uniref:ABC transporter permease n=1 Tax=Klebsiella pneumoniae TaxID=573 RepID=UPI004035A340